MKTYKNKQGEIYNGKSIVVEDRRIINSTEEDKRQQRMAEIQAELAATDYLTLKAFEGEDMSEHEGWKEKRKALREEYRRLEA